MISVSFLIIPATKFVMQHINISLDTEKKSCPE